MNTSLLSNIPIATLPIPPDRIVDRLSSSKLLVKYIRSTIIEEVLVRWGKSPECAAICADLNIDPDTDRVDLLTLYKQAKFSRLVRSRFLERKSHLDLVLFSAIQVKSFYLAQELYCRIKEENQSFIHIATRYSDSPAARRGGAIGPVSLLQLSPSIQYQLAGLQPKQLSPIFPLEDYYVFLQLDRYLLVQLTPQIEQQLLDELFEEWLQAEIRSQMGNMLTSNREDCPLSVSDLRMLACVV